MVAGPSLSFYQQMVAAEVAEERAGRRPPTPKGALRKAAERLSARVLSTFPLETDFDDAGGTNPRNNSSAIIAINLDQMRFLFTGDAGVPALQAALDYLEREGRTSTPLKFVQIPHHGSRHNGSRDQIERMLGSATNEQRGAAFVSISKEAANDPRYPSPRITNAYGRRGYVVCQTAGSSICNSEGAPDRGWHPIQPLPPRDEAIDDRE